MTCSIGTDCVGTDKIVLKYHVGLGANKIAATVNIYNSKVMLNECGVVLFLIRNKNFFVLSTSVWSVVRNGGTFLCLLHQMLMEIPCWLQLGALFTVVRGFSAHITSQQVVSLEELVLPLLWSALLNINCLLYGGVLMGCCEIH